MRLISTICLSAYIILSPVAAQPTKFMSVDELIKLFAPPPSQFDAVLPWDIGSDPGTKVKWKSSGLQDCDDTTGEFRGGIFCRFGEIIVGETGKPAVFEFRLQRESREDGRSSQVAHMPGSMPYRFRRKIMHRASTRLFFSTLPVPSNCYH